jgi:hypothetical protein
MGTAAYLVNDLPRKTKVVVEKAEYTVAGALMNYRYKIKSATSIVG